MFDKDEIKKALIEAFPDSMIELNDDGVHFHATMSAANLRVKLKFNNIKWFIVF